MMKRFIIVYEPTELGMRSVARILHGMRDLAAELDRDAGDDGRGSYRTKPIQLTTSVMESRMCKQTVIA